METPINQFHVSEQLAGENSEQCQCLSHGSASGGDLSELNVRWSPRAAAL